ncbi:60S ribosomal protein L10A [Handroanthus impetiginosus]|uniref:CL1 n=1 Tax=Handroanthus impetiginosus TaxID=429701 RepID=A0A2G9GJM6_9LAMI|nr:60S ribosomal protein L10A [Handroanthus impetiginosus]
MAAFKCLLSQPARRCFSDAPPCHRLVSLIGRQFSTEPQPSPNPEPSTEQNANLRKPVHIQPVSYPAKPRAPPSEETQHESPPDGQSSSAYSSDFANLETRSWTRDEMRYIKDASFVPPVSYPSRVAPLPEDRIQAGEAEREDGNEEFERERRRIEEDRQIGLLRFGKREEEEENVPFPKLIKVENPDQNNKKKAKMIYDLKEAIRLVKASAKKTFDETLEAHVRMTTELRRTDLKLSGFVHLPHGFGKTYRVAVFAEGAAADEARDAGADIVGGPELVENIRTGELKIDFDKCISTPSMMAHVKKLSRNLKQLMPDTKKGTLTNDISRAVKEAKEQSVLFKKDKTAIVHAGLGKVSFSDDALRENIGAFVNALLLAKPAGLKKSSKYAGYVDSFQICSTMGPSFPISIQSLSMAADRYNRLQVQ